MRTKVFAALALLLLFGSVSLVWGQAKVGTAGAQFLEIGISARGVAMGEAFTSVVDDASSVYYNPAGIALIQGKEVMFTHILYLVDMNFSFGAFVFPVEKIGGTLAAAVYYLEVGEMEVTDMTYPIAGASGQTFNPKEYAFTLSYARNLTDRLSIGITGKYIGENFGEGFFNTTTGETEDFHATGWAADVGTIYNTGFRGFKIGMIISNFGPDLNFGAGPSQSYPLPANFKFGGAINLIQNHSHRTVFAAELAHPNDNVEKYNVGLEYWYNETFALRFGNQFKQDSYLGGVSFGGGIKLPFNNQKSELRVDYAYRDFGRLEQAHRFTFGYNF